MACEDTVVSNKENTFVASLAHTLLFGVPLKILFEVLYTPIISPSAYIKTKY